MLLLIVPQFKAIYADLGGTLPLPTRILISVSDLLKTFFPIFIILGVAGFFLFRRWARYRRASRSGTRSSSACRCSAA